MEHEESLIESYQNKANCKEDTHKPIIFTGDKRFLVMARVGDKSLHKEWTESCENKNFDLFLEYFGDGSNDFSKDCDFYSEGKETKWPRFYKIIEENGEQIFKYDAVWMPDDDISTNCSTINEMFQIFMDYKLSLAQPALTKDSYYSHKITRRNAKYFLRYTNFVEVMVPIFSREALKRCWESFTKSKSGWGLDSIWPKLLGNWDYNIAIFDKTAVKHTRPIGNGSLYNDIQCSAEEELWRICEEYEVTLPFDSTIYGKVKNK